MSLLLVLRFLFLQCPIIIKPSISLFIVYYFYNADLGVCLYDSQQFIKKARKSFFRVLASGNLSEILLTFSCEVIYKHIPLESHKENEKKDERWNFMIFFRDDWTREQIHYTAVINRSGVNLLTCWYFASKHITFDWNGAINFVLINTSKHTLHGRVYKYRYIFLSFKRNSKISPRV